MKNLIQYTIMGLIIAYIFLLPVLGEVEGYLFPPVTEPYATRLSAVSPTVIMLSGRATQNRSCEFMGVDFTYSNGSSSTNIPWRNRVDYRPQDNGPILWGPWDISISLERLANNSENIEVTAIFSCHMFYDTIVNFNLKDIMSELRNDVLQN